MATPMRSDGRAPDELRPVTIELGFQPYAAGSALIACGATRVLCAATLEETVPPWLQGRGRGWITAEYGMLPASTQTRISRARSTSSGRTFEIQRLIGRALRTSVNLDALGERMVTVDCDVIQADGGTRTAAITGGYVALALALQPLVKRDMIPLGVFQAPVAAVSVGLVESIALLDLAYAEDAAAEVDCNIVMNGRGEFIELQGTAEGRPFSRQRLDELIDLAAQGIEQLFEVQRRALRELQSDLGGDPFETHT
jgi:ribonuclease PH